MRRSSKEIKIKEELLQNNNVSVEIGTPNQKEAPKTIYLSFNFWAKPKNRFKDQIEAKKALESRLKELLETTSRENLNNNKWLSSSGDHIFIVNVPVNFNHNDKMNFINFELYLHTCNTNHQYRVPLSSKEENPFYSECLILANKILSNDLFGEKSDFLISKKKYIG